MATTLSLKDLVNQNSKTKTASNLGVNAQKTSSLKDVLASNNQGQKTALERLQENKAFNEQYGQKNTKPTPTNTGNGLGYVAGKLGTGAFSILEGAWDYTAGGIASFFGADEWAEEQFANNISGRWNQELDENYNPNDTMKLVGDVSGGLGNSLLMFGVGTVATVVSAGAALPAIIVTAGVGAAGQSTASAYEKTGELGLKEYGYGALSGATEGALEGLTGAAGKQVAKVLAKNTAKSVVKKGVIKGVFSSGVGEAVEEGLSEFLDPYYLRATQVDPNAENATFQQIGYAGLVGSISGMLMGGVGETARAVKSNHIGNNIAKDQNKVNAVVNMAEKFANYENQNATGKQAYQYINQLVSQYKSADDGSGNLTQKQKRLLGEMQQVNTALVFEPAVSKSKEKIIANAEAFVEYLNSKNIVDATTGKAIHFDNVDAFIKNDYLVTQFAVSDALGELMLSSDSVYDYITQKNTNGLTQDSFRNFQKNATLEQKMAVNKMLGGDVDSLAYEDVIKRIKETDATQIKNVEAGINALKASRKAMMTARNNNTVSAVFDGVKNVKDGTTLYQTKTGKEIAITKNGDKFYLVYNGKVSKELTASKLGELIKAIDEEAKAKAEKKQAKQAEKQQETKKTEDSTEKKETPKESENTAKKQEATDKKKPKVSDYFQKESKKEKMAREGYTPLEMKKAEAFARAKVKGYEDLSVGDKLEVEWTIASGWKLGASEADIISLANISAKAGIGVGFANLTAKTAKGKEVSVDAACYKNNDKLTIYINPKSNRSVEVATLHELTHALKGTKGYAELEAMAKDYYEKHPDEKEAIDSSYRQLYKKEIQKYEQEILPEELTAHYVEKMLEKRNVLTKLTEEQPSLMKRSIKWLKDRVNLLKNVDERATKEIQRLTNKFVSTFNLKTSMATANGKAVAYSYSSMQHTFFGDKEGITIKDFENRSYKKEQGYKDFKNKSLNNMRQAMGKNFKAIDAVKEVEKSIDGIVDVAVAMKKAGYDILDVKEKRTLKDSKDRLLFASLEPNSDYFTSSDISTICDKRVNFTEIYEDIVRKETQLGVPKGKRFFDNVDNYFAIHKIMADKGLTTPCEQCYVESMRKNLSPMAKAFITLMQEKDANNTKNDQLYQQSGKNKGQEKANNAKLRANLLEKIEQEQYDITVDKLNYDMLTTADGLAQLKVQAPFIYEAFNSFYGQSKPKLPKEATPYRFGELTALLTDDNGNIKKGLVDKIVSTGGFRFQSYSDFQIKNFADVLQVIFEAGTLGLNGHAYTKVPAFLDATKDTNLKRNISIFMYQDGKQWKIDRNDSFPYTLDKIYDIVKDDKQGNTGIIAVTQNEVMAAYVMANDNIAYFIPFHKSGMKMSVVRDTDVKVDGKVIKGYKNIKDHTRQQSEVWAKGENALKKVKNAINIYEFWDFENADNLSKNELIEKNVKEYINRCEEAGYLPKFREYVMNNDKVLNDVLAYSKELGFVGENATIDDISFEHKGYRIPYGYYKCLGDFGMFTPDGKASKIEKLSLKNYDFQKAVDFFADAESLRRTELLQQIANGKERQRYITGDKKHMTTDQIAKELQSKRDEVVADVLGENHQDVRYALDKSDKIRYAYKARNPQTVTKSEFEHHYWAAANGILTKDELGYLNSAIGEMKKGTQYIKNADGFYMVPVGENGVLNKIVFTDGKYNSYSIDTVITINLNNETDLSIERSIIYASERKGIYTETNGLVEVHYAKDFKFSDFQRKLTQNPQNSNGKQNGAGNLNGDSDNGIKRSYALSVVDSNGKKLSEAQAEYFKDSKVRDEDGNLMVVYHGSANKFTEFKHSKIGVNGTSLGKGFYFTEDKSLSSGFYKEGGQLLEGYLDIKKPLSSEHKTIKKSEVTKLIKEVCKKQAQAMVDDGEYDSIQEAIRDTFVSNYVNTYETSMDNAYRQATDMIYPSCDSDADIVGDLINGGGGTSLVLSEVRRVLGFDGVIFEHSKDKHEYVAFESNQFKNADNKAPTENPDIRYSIKGSDKVMTELPSDEVTLKDVISGKANAKELVVQKKANTVEKTEATKILMTNAQAGVERVLKQGGTKDATAITNYVRAGKAAALNAIDIKGGQYNLTSDVRVGDSLGKIMKPIYDANKKDGKTYADFELYLLHWHNIDRMAQNKPVFHDENTPIEQQVTADDSREAIAELEKQYPQFKKIAEKLWKFNDNNLQLAVDSGMYSQEYADDMRLMYPHYVPTFRETYANKAGALLGKNRIGINNMKKAAKGSEAKILPIDDMIASQTIQKTSAARMNKLLVEMMENGNNDDFSIIGTEDADIDIDTETEVTFSDKDKNYQINFFYQGKKVTAQVSWAVYKGIEAFRPTSELSNNVAVAVTAKLNSWFKKGVTSLNPFFSFFKNPIRDMQDALLYTKYSSSDFLKNYNRARNEIQSNGKYWQEAKAAGITASNVYDYQVGIEYKRNDIVAKGERVFDKMSNASNAIEMSPRLAEYICAREAGLSVQEALLQAQDVTTNFGRGGTFAKTLNSTIMPFLNPSIQGFSKMVRAYMGEDGKKAWITLILKSLLLGVGASALNDLLNGDDEEYENLSDSVKENNYVLALGDGDFLKIPKGRVFSVFGSAFLRGRRYAEGDEKAWEGYGKSILSAVTPVDNITRTIFSPITDIQTNTTWYGGKIEGQKWDDTAPKDRYDESTSKISIWLGQVFDYSPIKINYLLEQYTGIVGDLVLPATSAQSSGSGSVNAVITQNMLSNATTNSKWSGKFYDAIEDYTYKKTAGDVQAKGVVKYLTAINKQVSEMYNDKRKVQADTTLSEKERLTQAKILQATINTLIQETLGNVDYLYNELGKYNLSNDDSDESTKAFNNAYRDCMRTIIGAEYALSTYNSDVYAKAKQLNTLGIGYETYYDYYFDTKGLTTERDENGNVIYTSKSKVLAYTNQQNLPTLQKIILLMSKGYTVADGDIKGVSAKRAKKMVAQYISSLKVSREEKTALAKMLGLTVKNGKIYYN